MQPGPVVSQVIPAGKSPSHELKPEISSRTDELSRTTKNESAPSTAALSFLWKPL